MPENGFYLGRTIDPKSGKPSRTPVLYDPADLTTHGVVMGMTGSGKTGLCITILEEAALQGIPALVIDPKGDLTNLLLHFPDLAPQDFKPWIDPDLARRVSRTVDEAAVEAAQAWRAGLDEWGIPTERILALKNAVQFAIYTPGSDAGIPVSVLSALAAPDLAWEGNQEALREQIASTATALLGLVGFNDVDPLRSREHILLSNLFESAWSEGKDVELTELILQIQSPPFEKLGAFSVETFFPARDRMALAMQLNNILAAPSFKTWREGQPLDIQSLLYAPDGRPCHSVFYLAHLSDVERMFFVTLLLSAIETWMRTQAGTADLRALVYMDEIFGYLPPVAVPPSKGPLLRMLKQARAFGLGLLLATQNPVDVDYKGLSNAGTWFIGKLQTDQDKQRLLDGLESATGGASRTVFDKLISSLDKREFILQNVHSRQPVVFHTRWAMNFLPGPLTRNQIPALNELAGAGTSGRLTDAAPIAAVAAPAANAAPVPVTRATSEASQTKPPVPAGLAEYFLPQNLSLPEAFQSSEMTMPAAATIQGVVYHAALLAAAQVRFLDRKYGVDVEITRAALVSHPEQRGSLRWDDFAYSGPSLDKMQTVPAASARFGALEAPLDSPKLMTALQKDFTDWVYRSTSIKARANAALKTFAGPEVTQAEFMKICAEAARTGRDAEIEKKTALIDKKIKTLENKKAREERELRQDQADLQNRNIEAGANLLELGASLVGLGRKKSVTTQFTKHRLAQDAKADVEESQSMLEQYTQELASLQAERQQVQDEVNTRWGDVVNQITEITFNAKKTDIYVNHFGVAWLPYYVVRAGTDTLEMPAFGAE